MLVLIVQLKEDNFGLCNGLVLSEQNVIIKTDDDPRVMTPGWWPSPGMQIYTWLDTKETYLKWISNEITFLVRKAAINMSYKYNCFVTFTVYTNEMRLLSAGSLVWKCL